MSLPTTPVYEYEEDANIIVGRKTNSEKRFLQEFARFTTDADIEKDEAIAGIEDISCKVATYGNIFKNFNKLNYYGLDFAFSNHIVSPLTYLSKIKKYDNTVASVIDSKWIKYVIKGSPSFAKKKVFHFIKIVIQDGGAAVTDEEDDRNLEILGRLAFRLNMKKALEKTEKVAKRLKVRESDVKIILFKMKILF